MLEVSGLSWGDVPTWIGSVGTTIPLATGAVVFAQSQSDRRRSQSGKVTAWVSGGPAIIPAGEHWEGDDQLIPGIGQTEIPISVPRVWIDLSIRNNSDDLITDVIARLMIYPGRSYWGGIETRWPELAPGLTKWAAEYMDSGVRGAAQVQLVFTDIRGRRWIRVGGQLRSTRRPATGPPAENPLGSLETFVPPSGASE